QYRGAHTAVKPRKYEHFPEARDGSSRDTFVSLTALDGAMRQTRPLSDLLRSPSQPAPSSPFPALCTRSGAVAPRCSSSRIVESPMQMSHVPKPRLAMAPRR